MGPQVAAPLLLAGSGDSEALVGEGLVSVVLQLTVLADSDLASDDYVPLAMRRCAMQTRQRARLHRLMTGDIVLLSEDGM